MPPAYILEPLDCFPEKHTARTAPRTGKVDLRDSSGFALVL